MWEGVGDRIELQYIEPHSYGHQCCIFLVLLMLNQRPEGPALCWVRVFSTASCHQRVTKFNRGSRGPLLLAGGFLYHTLSLTHLSLTHWLSVLTELYNSSIAHSVSILMASQAGICYFRRLWTGMFDHHKAEITVMQFRGHSLPVHQSMSVSWDFTLSHFVSQARLRDFFT